MKAAWHQLNVDDIRRRGRDGIERPGKHFTGNAQITAHKPFFSGLKNRNNTLHHAYQLAGQCCGLIRVRRVSIRSDCIRVSLGDRSATDDNLDLVAHLVFF